MFRRKLSLLALVAALGFSTVVAATAAAAPPEKVDVCAYNNGSESYVLKQVTPKNQDNYDGVPGGDAPVAVSGVVFGANCELVATGEVVFAFAYSNVDGVSGFDPATDVLIAKLIDLNGDFAPSIGDQLVVDRYPLDMAANQFGSFEPPTDMIVGLVELDSTVGVIDMGLVDSGGSLLGAAAFRSELEGDKEGESFSTRDDASAFGDTCGIYDQHTDAPVKEKGNYVTYIDAIVWFEPNSGECLPPGDTTVDTVFDPFFELPIDWGLDNSFLDVDLYPALYK